MIHFLQVLAIPEAKYSTSTPDSRYTSDSGPNAYAYAPQYEQSYSASASPYETSKYTGNTQYETTNTPVQSPNYSYGSASPKNDYSQGSKSSYDTTAAQNTAPTYSPSQYTDVPSVSPAEGNTPNSPNTSYSPYYGSNENSNGTNYAYSGSYSTGYNTTYGIPSPVNNTIQCSGNISNSTNTTASNSTSGYLNSSCNVPSIATVTQATGINMISKITLWPTSLRPGISKFKAAIMGELTSAPTNIKCIIMAMAMQESTDLKTRTDLKSQNYGIFNINKDAIQSVRPNLSAADYAKLNDFSSDNSIIVSTKILVNIIRDGLKNNLILFLNYVRAGTSGKNAFYAGQFDCKYKCLEYRQNIASSAYEIYQDQSLLTNDIRVDAQTSKQ